MTAALLLLLTAAAHLCMVARSSLDESALFMRIISPAHLAFTYEIIPAAFGPPFTAYQHTHRSVRMTATTVEESCSGLVDDVSGQVVIMPRGECSFVEKVAHAAAAGARFALVTEVNSSSSATISMSRGDSTAHIDIPSAYVAGTSGSRLHRFLSLSAEPVLVDIPINGTDVAILLKKPPWEIW